MLGILPHRPLEDTLTNINGKPHFRDEFDDAGRDLFSIEKEKRLNDPEYASRKIVIDTDFDDGFLKVTITDQGKGFDYQTTNAETDEIQVHGRGVSIMQGTMNKLIYSNGGRTVTLQKRLYDSEQES